MEEVTDVDPQCLRHQKNWLTMLTDTHAYAREETQMWQKKTYTTTKQ